MVAAVRWSPFGRALVAMRDSEAACATFGLNLLWPRLAVFMLSAGIAGLGGGLYGMQLGSVSADRFNLVAGLPIFMLVVVGGAGLVGGALFAALLLYAVVPVTSSLAPFVAKANSVTPGLVGVGMGRNPSGAVPLVKDGLGPLGQDPPVLGGMVAAMALVYGLRLADVIGNWPFALGVAAAAVVASVIASARTGEPGDAVGAEAPVDLEWVGVTEPWTEDLVARVSEGVALRPTVSVGARAGEEVDHGHP